MPARHREVVGVARARGLARRAARPIGRPIGRPIRRPARRRTRRWTMTPELTDSELERQLTTMLQERAGALSERAPVDTRVVTRARRRRGAKLASLGSGAALVLAAVVAVTVSLTGSSVTSSKHEPASPGPSVRLSPPTYAVQQPVPARLRWQNLPAAPISARSASAA